ncbi:MAG: hypothetical protein KAS36_17010 [Anaerolineales bacterium]|uniref:Uncharacterized protein n=1 Tax=marine metagenome TaxID=408172 RepID=A0A382CCM6_9ZZZZ|nr:hypothetical protein [Anaerolineales bacterium]
MGAKKDKTKKTTALKADEIGSINRKFEADSQERKEFGRSSWMALIVPAVGTFAVLSSLVLNIVRTYKKHGFPEDTFRTRDLVIVAIPALLIGFATLEAMEILDPDHVGDV